VTVDLRLGDCLEIMKTLPAGSVDAVVTDPPYGLSIANHGQSKRKRKSIPGDDSMTVGNEVLLWAESLDLPVMYFASPRRPWPGTWRNLIVWDKGGAVGGGGDLRLCLKLSWELIQIARNRVVNGGRDVSVWRHLVTPASFHYHTCEKPIELMVRLIETFTRPGDTVLDPFMGSGTTGVACVQTGRHFIGCEIDPTYFAIAEKRIAAAQAQLRLPLEACL
jgi:DNA modification methylase